ncbi:ABC transporter substrate-binding protein [Lacibacter sp. H407]|uniref:ABC transporter substrate-binding protein n=1 Tax=Lacibacter sp. H407 TaxID=3133423 RepID=UPI0030C1999D
MPAVNKKLIENYSLNNFYIRNLGEIGARLTKTKTQLLLLKPISFIAKLMMYGTLICVTSKSVSAADSIRIHLKWWHQFQFAGYYAAQLKGFYTDEGLNVKIIPADKDHPPVAAVLNGTADFGITGSDLILNHAMGQKIVVLGTVFQHSPYTVISPAAANINFPSDLIGKKIMASQDQGWVQLQALFLKEGIPLDSLRVIPHTWNNADLLNGHADAMTGYISVEPRQLELTGIKVNTILPVNYGIDFYGDLLFTTQEMAKENPLLTEKIRKASFKGWDYALAHPEEIAEYILTLPGVKERNVRREALLFEAAEMRKLILPMFVEIGHQNEGRWQHILDVHKSLGIIDSAVTLDGFIYNPGKSESGRLWRIIFISGIVTAFIITMFFAYGITLRKAVRKRTRELELEVKERTRAQEQLLINKERLKMAVQAAGIGIWDLDLDNDTVSLGDSFATNLGYDSNELANDRNFLRSQVHPDDLPELAQTFRAQIETSIESPGIIIRLKTKSGEWKWCLLISRVLKRDHKNRATHLTGIYLDVDDLKKKEVELSDLSSTLLKRNSELQQFAYITSHNLRSPVANLLSLTRLFKKDELGEINSSYFSKITECVFILHETLNDVNEILSFRTAAEEKPETVQLEQLLKTVITSIGEWIQRTETKITHEFAVQEIAFPKRILHSVFQNLITNAIKYRKPGSIAEIHITTTESKDSYTIAFTDNGSGIDLEKYGAKMFQLFQRFHTGVDGKGMGLYIVKSQLESHNGSIHVSSKKDHGTVFTITLPKTPGTI